MTTAPSAREIHLASRPAGPPTPENFALVTRELPALEPGQILVRNDFMSVDPYMRGRMSDAKSYVAPFEVGAVMDGGAVGTVVESTSDIAVGTTVLHGLGWRDYAIVDARHARPVDPSLGASAYLGVLGMPGLTAYVGLLDIAAMKPGDVVFVSGAAGAVGSLVGQIAKLRGASRVIGSAGSASKVDYLVRLGYDAAFNYKDGPVRDSLKAAAPDGIDVYFDNVGGEHLEAAISSLRTFGRVAMCGAISSYNAATPGSAGAAGPRNLGLAVGKRLTLKGFIVNDHNDRRDAFVQEVGGWLAGGQVTFAETVVDGLENAPRAFIGLLNGDNTGKMVVRL